MVSVAFLGANTLSYVFVVLAARTLVPAAYGELAALMSVLLVGTVPATGVQTAAALFLGGGRENRAPSVARLHTTALVTGLAVIAVGAIVAAPVGALLHLPDAAALGWLLALLLPHTLISGYQGVLQGEGSYGRLAVTTAAFAATKLAGGTAGLLLGGTPTSAVAGMTVGASIGALVGWWLCRRPGFSREVRGPAAAALRASGALLGFVLLLNLDVLLARHHLPAQAAGEYAVGAVFAKVAFWLPQGIGVMLLPRLADAGHRRRLLPLALAVVAAAGALLTLCTAALGASALPLVGGSAYGDSLGAATWVFAALGTLLALAQLLLFSGIASADRLATAAVWAAAAAECLAVQALAAAGRLSVVPLAVVALATAVLLVGVGLVRSRQARPDARELAPTGPEPLEA
ncbi:MAG: Membrane protein involved in the export of O-antigen and teichoic acid [Blastococcus sp.]|jgi:O-antigen/teichoic acid export membrane protein|nr:Membrane protein involved in the export of O-antigen and teichoic acid [Blastococcus sp.]